VSAFNAVMQCRMIETEAALVAVIGSVPGQVAVEKACSHVTNFGTRMLTWSEYSWQSRLASSSHSLEIADREP
jgi:hypothetical protein